MAVKALRASGQLSEVADEALVTGLLALAGACDEDPLNAALWREYRAFVQAVREAAAGGSDDDTTAFIVSVQTPRRAPVGNGKNSGKGVVRTGDRGGGRKAGAAVDAVATPGRGRRGGTRS